MQSIFASGLRSSITACLFLFIFSPLHAQSLGEISGTVTDSAGAPLSAATVSLVRLADSTLWGFFLTDDDGGFYFRNVTQGRYRIVVSRMGFSQQTLNADLTPENPSARQLLLTMRIQDVRLNEVMIVEEAPPVTLRGDTLEFNAGSFRTIPNAVAEDLLRKLPGVEIQTDGTIKVNGQTVNKVLVDGKEFFGSDPKIATQNLPAEAVKKVQVFDQKSDGEQLTGMDDGQTDMTINLTLKNEHKNGTFGSLTGGYGTRNRWNGKANVNVFNPKSQFSILANGNNVNEQAFSWWELMQFTGATRDMMSGGGRNSMSASDGIGFPVDQLVNSQNQGVNTQTSGGIRGSRDWGEKLSLTGNYFFLYYAPDQRSTSDRIYLLPDSTYSSVMQTQSLMKTFNHRIEADLRYEPVKNTKFRFKPVVSFYSLGSDQTLQTANRSDDQLRGSNAANQSHVSTDSWIFSGDARFSKGFRRRGRSFTSQWTGNYRPSSTRQDLVNQITVFTPDTTFAGNGADQRWFTDNGSHNENLKLTYSEPLFNRWLAEANANLGLTESMNAREAWARRDLTTSYDSLVSGLSNSFESHYLFGSAGVKLKRAGKKLTLSAGANWQQAQLTGKIVQNQFSVEKTFGRLLPNAQLEYKLSQFRNLTLNYRSALKPPSVTQLQPLADITNPLMISSGNPDLAAQTDHTVSLALRVVDPAKGRSFVLNTSGTLSQDAIGQSQSIDERGVSTTIPVNVKGNWNVNGNLFLRGESKKLRSEVSFEPRMSFSRSGNLVNGAPNPALSQVFTPVIRYTFEPTDSFEINLRASRTWNENRFLNGTSTRVTSWNLSGEWIWILPKGFTINSTLAWSVLQSSSGTTQFPLWKASVSKSLFKGGRGELRLSAFDILKKNTGISQTASNVYTEVLTYNTMTRYYMLSFTWRLSPYKEDRSRMNWMRFMY